MSAICWVDGVTAMARIRISCVEPAGVHPKQCAGTGSLDRRLDARRKEIHAVAVVRLRFALRPKRRCKRDRDSLAREKGFGQFERGFIGLEKTNAVAASRKLALETRSLLSIRCPPLNSDRERRSLACARIARARGFVARFWCWFARAERPSAGSAVARPCGRRGVSRCAVAQPMPKRTGFSLRVFCVQKLA